MRDYRSKPHYKEPSLTVYKPRLGDTMTSREQRDRINRAFFPEVRRNRVIRWLVGFGLLLAVLAFACSCTRINYQPETGEITITRILQDVSLSVETRGDDVLVNYSSTPETDPVIDALKTGAQIGAASATLAP